MITRQQQRLDGILPKRHIEKYNPLSENCVLIVRRKIRFMFEFVLEKKIKKK